MNSRSREAARLVKPLFGRRRYWPIPANDGLRILKWRAHLRGAALTLRWFNGASLALAMLILFAAETQQALLMVIATGLLASVLETFATGPFTTRPRRIVRDRRPILLRDVIAVPAQKRAGRIVRDRPPPIRLDLPPPRPRSRLVERRTGPFVEDLE